jgi:hypothetical protein
MISWIFLPVTVSPCWAMYSRGRPDLPVGTGPLPLNFTRSLPEKLATQVLRLFTYGGSQSVFCIVR